MLLYRIIGLAALALTVGQIYGQGQVDFNTHAGSVDARDTYLDGPPVGPEFTAQLLIAGTNSSTFPPSFVPAVPTTMFVSSPQSALGYVVPVTATSPVDRVNSPVTVYMRAYNGTTWETSSIRGQSSQIEIALGGGPFPPTSLRGLQPFDVAAVPEPSIFALEVFAIASLGVFSFSRWNVKRARR